MPAPRTPTGSVSEKRQQRVTELLQRKAVLQPQGVEHVFERQVGTLPLVGNVCKNWVCGRIDARVSADEGRTWKPWMNIVDAADKKVDGVEVWGLTLEKNRAWAVGMGSVAAPGAAQTSGDSDPLIVSWAW